MIIIVTVIQNYSITRTIPVPSNSPFLNPGNHHSIFHLYIFFILKILRKWNHTICDLLIIAFYSSQIMYLRSIQIMYIYFVVKLLSHVQLFITPWTEAQRTSLSFTISQSVSCATQPSHPLLPTSLAFKLPQHQGLFQ